jgi:hypothetical protein
VRPPAGLQRLAWRFGTIAFLIATSTLFFASLNEVIPVYVIRSP